MYLNGDRGSTTYLHRGRQFSDMTDENGNGGSDGSGDSSGTPSSILGGQRVSKGGRRGNSGSDSGDSGE